MIRQRFLFLFGTLPLLALLFGCSNQLESGDVIFLATDASGRYQLFSLTPTEPSPAAFPLTQFDADILDFAINGDQEIAFTVADDDLSSDIWFFSPNIEEPIKVVDCQNAACRNPKWSPTLATFMYESRPIIDGEIDENMPTLWWFDLPSQQSVQVFQVENWIGREVRFAADGESFSYVVPLIDEAQIYHIPTGEVSGISSRTGTPLEWGLSDDIYFSALLVRHDRSTTHILKTNRAGTVLIDLSGPDSLVEDGGYSVSPAGDRLAFTRKPPRAPAGRQIWVMGTDGADARSLTNELSIQHGAVSWSADGGSLVFQRFDLDDPAARPTFWVIDVESGDMTELGVGTRPQWVP